MDNFTITISFPVRFIELLMNSVNILQDFGGLFQENVSSREQSSPNSHQATNNVPPREQTFPQQQQPHTNNARPAERPTPQNDEQSQPSTQTHEAMSQNSEEIDENALLRAEISRYRDQNIDLIRRFGQLQEELNRKKIDSFETLIEQDKESAKVLIELAHLTPPMPMEGNNIGLFGLTSTGKSTMLNAIFGQKVAETGVGETTKTIKPYTGTHFTLWDVPGRNDELNYFSMEYISFFKGLTRRLILIQATIKENSSMMKLLDAIGLHYTIVFNKFDKLDEDERTLIQQQIDKESKSLNLKGVEHVFFVSAKTPTKFSDWQTMVQYMETSSR